MLRTSAPVLLAASLLVALAITVPTATASYGLFEDDGIYIEGPDWINGHPISRSLQDADPKWLTVVQTPQDFMKAILQGDTHIEVREHLDFSLFEVSKVFNWTATFHLPETIRTIRGNCELQFPDALTSGIEGAPMLPQKPGQCLMAFDQIFLAAQSSAGRKIWMDNLYLRDSRGETNSSLSDWNPSDPANQIVVMLASGKQYDDLPASSARHLYLTNVTIQGNGVDGSRGLYNTGRLFAQDCVFAHLGNVEGLPPVKVRLPKATANFRDCLFLDNFSPNFFGPIMAEERGAVRLQECTFSGNEPELVDSFSKGVFFSDQELTVWNDDKGRYEMAGTLEDAEEARNWLYGSSNFLTKQRARFGLPPLAQAVEAPPPEIIEEPVEPPVEATVPTEGPEPAVEPDPEVAPPPDEVPDNGTMTEAPKAAPPLTDDTMIVNPSDPNGVDNGDDGTDIVDESGGREENGLNPAIIGGAAAGAAVLLLSAIGCFVMRGRKKPNPGLNQNTGFPIHVNPGYNSGPGSAGSGVPPPHMAPGYPGSVPNPMGSAQGSALPQIMAANPWHPTTITRYGGYDEHDMATGRAPGSGYGGPTSSAGRPSDNQLVPSSSGLPPGPQQSAIAVQQNNYDTEYYEEDFDHMDPPGPGASVDEKMAFLQHQLDTIGRERKILNGLLLLGGGRFERLQGGQAVVQMARNPLNGLDYAIKFFISNNAFDSEKELYNDKSSPLGKFLPQVRDIVSNDDCSVMDPAGNCLPPCIVMERGESLDIWSARARPDRWQAFTCIQHLANRLVNLHNEGYVHRDLKPGNVMWLPRENRWTVIDFGCAAKTGKESGLGFSIMYAAPEVIAAYRAGKRKMLVTEALDTWSLGVLAIELLTGEMPLDLQEGAESIMDRIEGKNGKQLPWEEDKNRTYFRHKLGIFKNTLIDLMSREPEGRPTMRQFSAQCAAILGGSGSVEQN